jgi:hypothetical protein
LEIIAFFWRLSLSLVLGRIGPLDDESQQQAEEWNLQKWESRRKAVCPDISKALSYIGAVLLQTRRS